MSAGSASRKSSSVRFWLTVIFIVALISVAGTWSLATILRPTATDLGEQYSLVSVSEGSVGSSIRLNAVARWESQTIPASNFEGIITEVNVSPGQVVDVGEEVFTVNLQGAYIARGDVPMFRTLTQDVSGKDVLQLQNFLLELGYYPYAEPNSKFDSATRQAVIEWQKSRGIAVTGEVSPAEIVFLPQLPARIWFDTEKIAVGASLTNAEQSLGVYGNAPRVFVSATAYQSTILSAGNPVTVSWGEHTWEGIVGNERETVKNSETVEISITAPDGTPICGDICHELSFTTDTLLPLQAIVIPEQHGLVVPSAAIMTGAAGETMVINAAGEKLPVTVLQQARGMSLIEGVPVGTQLRLPAVSSRAETENGGMVDE